MTASPFKAAASKSARAQNVKTFKKTKSDIENAYTNGASSKEEVRYSPEYGKSINAMDEAKANIARRKSKAAGMDAFGGLKAGATAKAFAEVLSENRDVRTPEQKAKDIAAASAGRTNADIAASQPSAAARVMQVDEPPQSAFGQANRSGSLSSRGPTKVGRSYNDPERARERFNRRNEQASRVAYGF